MIDVENVSLPLLIGALAGFVTIMGAAIVYVARQERKKEEEEAWVLQIMRDRTRNDFQRCCNGWRYGNYCERWTSKEKQASAEKRSVEGNIQTRKKWWSQHLKTKEQSFSHPWNVTVLKGHKKEVTDIAFASDGKKFVSISGDRTVILWDVRDFENKEHKSIRQIVEYDTPTKVVFAPDCKSVVFSVKRDNKVTLNTSFDELSWLNCSWKKSLIAIQITSIKCFQLCVFKLAKKTEGSGSHIFVHIDNLEFERVHQVDIQSIGIAGNGIR